MIETETRLTDQPAQAFDDPVTGAQRVFRAVLQALSRPGEHVPLPVSLPYCPAMPSGLAAITLALADYETPLWLDATLAGDESVRQFLAFHTGAPLTNDTGKATFALAACASQLPDFAQFAIGTLEYPDRSTTIVAAVTAFDGGKVFHLEGPGIDGRVSVAPQGLPEDFPDRMTRNHALFPRGVDIILVAGHTIIGLPRSVNIME